MNKSQRHRRDHIRRMVMEDTGYFGGVCPECGGEVFYYYRFDAHCCLGCGIWLNEKCSDPGCVYCSRRPDSPLEALVYERYRSGGKDWRRGNWLHKERGRRKEGELSNEIY